VRQAHLLGVVWGQYSTDSVEYRTNIRQEGDRPRFIIWFTDIGMTVENIVNLPVFATVLSENVPQEHHLFMLAVFITKSSSPVQQRAIYSMYICSIEIEIGMGGFAVYFVA
jgi:hypothetical protein